MTIPSGGMQGGGGIPSGPTGFGRGDAQQMTSAISDIGGKVMELDARVSRLERG